MKTIKDLDVSGKRLFLRADFNVPLDAQQRITDDSRIRSVLPTIYYALEQGAKLILASHLGRPRGEVVPSLSLRPVADRLSELLGKTVQMAPASVGSDVLKLVSQMRPGDVVLLENLRFHAEEDRNDPGFAEQLAALCDVYVNDAFAVCHRANASVEAITRHVPLCAAGILLQRELDYFEKAMTVPERPLAAVVGGAKVSSKLAALENLLQRVDKLIIGGAMANTFLKQMGLAVGISKVEDDLLIIAGSILKTAAEKGVKLYLPVDAVIARRLDPQTETKIVAVQEIPPDWMVLDIGPASVLLFAEILQDVRTVVWNGPLGVFEMDAFSNGTLSMARHLADSKALTIVGGGDTAAAVHQAGKADQMGYISTGGGAFLALLEGKTLPAVAALEAAQKQRGA
ncbi:MAG: phosphoglycerate kinase [Desulfobacterales bacterium]|nr:phosphoglycerate kinase [Desulfobacterales bacterium]